MTVGASSDSSSARRRRCIAVNFSSNSHGAMASKAAVRRVLPPKDNTGLRENRTHAHQRARTPENGVGPACGRRRRRLGASSGSASFTNDQKRQKIIQIRVIERCVWKITRRKKEAAGEERMQNGEKYRQTRGGRRMSAEERRPRGLLIGRCEALIPGALRPRRTP